ncbi:class I SAM-dependent methyltransferase [Novisyntrophococcus fermenticellae]|uniref:class I SAM-dependent methyltransferase n=1 Tax=Novisyntrophococcus fermenticellae TaxID=2068655 RepID=UPI001E52D170|nr:SAM-dependent methyltransferase [Novisyntrophococcus fermenticellae]
MEELRETLSCIFSDKIRKAIFSNQKNQDFLYRKIILERRENFYQVEKLTEEQAFHENLELNRAADYSEKLLKEGFGQLNAWGETREYAVKISKKGKILFQKRELEVPVKIRPEHNRRKRYLLEEGVIIPPLIDMGVFTKEGKVVRTMYDKFRQINKFVEFIDDAVDKSGLDKLRIIDFGCGKSYLTFVVYYYLTVVKKLEIEMTGLDLKEDVIVKCNKAARKYGYDHLKFIVGDINGYQSEMPVDMVISLHACDTATDYALFNAIRWNAGMIISVPCCQHELCGQMNSEEISILQRYGIVKERTAALMTDAIRGNLLEYCGYKTQLMEFVDLSHTPKNLLIRAVKSNITQKHRQLMLEEIQKLCQCFQLKPALLRLLEESEML